MKLVIEGSSLGDGSAQRGIGTYVGELVRGLVREADFDVTVLAPQGTGIPGGATHRPARRIKHYRVGPLWQELVLPWEISRSGADLVHSPAQEPPRRSVLPWVQTLLDLTPLVFESPLLALDARRWRRIGPRLRQASAVIAISESSAEQGRRLLGLAPSKVHVIPLGVGPQFVPLETPVAGPPQLLWCSSWGPHKGLREAAAVFDALVESGLPHRLRVVGRNDAWMQARLEDDLAASRYRDRIDVVGWVPDLAAEYRASEALLVTSRAEGFGLPAAEAMACGTPVVSFDNTSLPELVGLTSPLLVPDGDVGEFARVTKRLLRSPALAAEERERGIERMRPYTWARTVSMHAEVYRAMLD